MLSRISGINNYIYVICASRTFRKVYYIGTTIVNSSILCAIIRWYKTYLFIFFKEKKHRLLIINRGSDITHFDINYYFHFVWLGFYFFYIFRVFSICLENISDEHTSSRHCLRSTFYRPLFLFLFKRILYLKIYCSLVFPIKIQYKQWLKIISFSFLFFFHSRNFHCENGKI